MSIKVEQIKQSGIIVKDYDNNLTVKQIYLVLKSIPEISVDSTKNPFIITYKNKEIKLCIKNISYLGQPHLHYKKRIQISKEWKELLQDDNTFLCGIYSYDSQIIFCLFDTTKYKNNALNNSSAHIHTMDLYKAIELGVFSKTDKNGNNITVFTKNNFNKVFNNILFNKNIAVNNELELFKDFSNTLNINWNGIDCYKEMIDNNFNNAYQAEWAGFYLEYKFSNFLKSNQEYKKYCVYISDEDEIQNKTKDSIDLDLWFDDQKYYGDLKTHDIDQNLLGNDKKSILNAIELYNKVWYVVFSHRTIKDKNLGEVTEFWNIELNKRFKETRVGKIKKLDSYLSKMKNSVKLDNFTILEINKFNQQYLKDFNQGKNSNNNIRNTKISIKKADIENDNFVIYRQKF